MPMGKPGSRAPHIKIIDRPELKTPARNLVERTLTAFLWALWVYGILPIVTVFLWLMGVKMTYLTLLAQGHLEELSKILIFGAVSILVVFTINIFWINYNYYFIHKKFSGRRKASVSSSEKEVAEFFKIDPTALRKLKHHNRFEVSLSGKTTSFLSATTVGQTTKDSSKGE